MRAYEFILESLLLEDRMDFLRNQYVPQLDQIIQNTPNRIGDLGDIPEISGTDVFNWMAEKDPTRKKIYLQWILTLFIKRNVPIEDISYVDDLLERFESMKSELDPKQRDINQYATVNQLQQLVDAREYQQAEFDQAEHDRALSQSRVLYNDDTWIVLKPQTESAAQYWGRGSEWCTAWGDPKGKYPTRKSQYKNYSTGNGLYIIRNKTDPTNSIQINFEEDELMDWNDERIEHDQIVQKYPVSKVVYADFYKNIEDRLLDAFEPEKYDEIMEWLIEHSKYTLDKPWSETGMPIGKDIEEYIANNADSALKYAQEVLRGPWHESSSPVAEHAERNIAQGTMYDSYNERDTHSPAFPLQYALTVLKKPWSLSDSKFSDMAEKMLENNKKYKQFVSEYEQSNN